MIQVRLLLTGILLFITTANSKAQPAPGNGCEFKLLSVQKIWDKAPHNAFTDLIRFNDRWFCVFREGKKHVSPDGSLRILTSTDGNNWESAALITSENADLRDAKITVTPSGQLMLGGAGALHDRTNQTHQSYVWFSDDGFSWSEAYPVGHPDFWLWSYTWNEGNVYSIGYNHNDKKMIRLYAGNNEKSLKPLVDTLYFSEYPNESSIVFSGDIAYCLLRRDGKQHSALLGMAMPPYTDWKWKDLGIRIGGPQMIRLPGGEMLAAVRLYKDEESESVRTALCKVDTQEGKMTEILTLPSGGDTSYPGMVYHKGIVWISYYSSHEEKTSIYLAKVKI